MPNEQKKITSTSKTSIRFDAFISYSHDATFQIAQQLQSGLQNLARSWLTRRFLSIFRDETDLSASPSLWQSIQDAMDASSYFIYLASPDAAQSVWVTKEIMYWRETKSSDRIIIVLTAGTFAWDDDVGDFDYEQSSAIPTVFRGCFESEPLVVDLTSFLSISIRDPNARSALATISAPIRGVSKEQLLGLHERQWRRRVAMLAITTVITALLAIFAFWQMQEARKQKAIAIQETKRILARQLITTAQSNVERFPQRSLLLAVIAMKVSKALAASDQAETESGLRALLSRVAGEPIATQAPVRLTTVSPDGRWLVVNAFWHEEWAHTSDSDDVKQYAVDTRRKAGEILLFDTKADFKKHMLRQHQRKITALSVSPNSKKLTSGSADGEVLVWTLDGSAKAHQLVPPNPLQRVSRLGFLTNQLLVVVTRPEWLSMDGKQPSNYSLRILNVNTGGSLLLKESKFGVDQLVLSRLNGVVAVAWLNGDVDVWKSVGKQWKHIQTIDNPDDNFSPMIFMNNQLDMVMARNYDTVKSLGLDRYGQYLVIGYSKGNALLVDLEHPKQAPAILPKADRVSINHEGTQLALVNMYQQCFLYDFKRPDFLESGKLLGKFDQDVSILAFSPSDRWLVGVGFQQNMAKVWSVSNHFEIDIDEQILLGHEHQINDIAFIPNQGWLITGANQLRKWTLHAGMSSSEPIILPARGRVSASSFSADSSCFYSQRFGGAREIIEWDMMNQCIPTIRQMKNTYGMGLFLLLHPNQQQLISISNMSEAGITVLDKRSQQDYGFSGPQGDSYSGWITPTGWLIIKPTLNNRLYARKIAKQQRDWLVIENTSITATNQFSGVLLEYDPNKPTTVSDILEESKIVMRQVNAFKTNQTEVLKKIVHSSDDFNVRFVLHRHNGQRLVTVDTHGRYRVFEAEEDGIRLFSFSDEKLNTVNAAKLNDDGCELILGHSNGDVCHIFLCEDKPALLIEKLHQSNVGAITSSTQDRLIASAGIYDRQIILRDGHSGASSILLGHEESVDSLQFTRLRDALVSLNRNEIILWRNLQNSWHRVKLPVLYPPVSKPQMTMSSNDRWMAISGATFPVILYRLRKNDLIDLACYIAGRGLTDQEWSRYGMSPYAQHPCL